MIRDISESRLITVFLLCIIMEAALARYVYIVDDSYHPGENDIRFRHPNPLQILTKPTLLRKRMDAGKRGCVLNAGLSQGCDLSDLLAAKHQLNRFTSWVGPGKRRKRRNTTK